MLANLAHAVGDYLYNVFVLKLSWIVVVGFAGQLMFSMRFIVQWIASERARRSIVPETFWYFSMVGGAMLFAYAIYRLDPVFMLGQGMGLLIYARNIYFIRAHNRATALAGEGSGVLRPEQPAGRAG